MLETEILYGRNPVVEAASAGRKIHRIWLTDKTAKALKKSLSNHLDLVEIVTKEEIGKITGKRDHQGAAAETEPFVYADFEAISAIARGVVIAEEGVTDPRNLGAIIRSAVLLGAKGVIIPSKNSAQITPVVCHTSAGATEHIAIAKTESLPHSLKLLKSKGFTIAGATVPNEKSTAINEYIPPEKTVLILGSEWKGLSRKIESICDILLCIPQKTDFDSFNVSVAASILLWELIR
mgnify:CR=1 FL=1